jgi:N-acetylmuramoyl-L-alanine amidase
MLIIKKRNALIAAAVLAVVVLGFVLSAFTAADSPSNDIVVVLDAGHGGIDGGATGISKRVKESDINLAITLSLEDMLKKAGVRVILTRRDENGLYGLFTRGFKMRDMNARKKIIEQSGCNILISIHLNTFYNPEVRGAQTFFNIKSTESRQLAKLIQSNFNKEIEPFKQRTELRGDYYLLECVKAASVIVECGFLSSPLDEALLTTAAHRERLARCIYNGAMQYLSIGGSVREFY